MVRRANRLKEAAPLRRQLLLAIAGITTLAIVLFVIPLAVAVQRLYHNEAVTQLERDATQVAAETPDDVERRPRMVALPHGVKPALTVGIYRKDGRRLAGEGPATSGTAAAAADGQLHQAIEDG